MFTFKDAMSNRLSDAMSRLNVDTPRSSLGRPPPSAGAKRNSGLDSSTINAMFPDAAAAIAKKKAEFTQQTGNAPPSNRNSAALGERASLIAPTISTPENSAADSLGQPPSSPWIQRPGPEPQPPIARPKSSTGQPQPMGQFSQPSAGLRSSFPVQQTASVPTPEIDPPMLSPYNVGNASWASLATTPMTATFPSPQPQQPQPQQHQQQQQQPNTQADMVANATAMKLAALSTVNNRIALDDARKYRRARSSDGQGRSGSSASVTPSVSSGLGTQSVSGTNLVGGHLLNAQQLAAIQAQQQAVITGQRSRPTSPGIAIQGPGGVGGGVGFAAPQNNGFLSAFDPSSAFTGNGFSSLGLGHLGMANHEGYISDHSDIGRSRSPRGRRGSSKPPEDPTDPALLKDIPSWLRSLRLHKYTDNLKDIKWTDLVELDDKALEDRGVNALGARNKMLKVSATALVRKRKGSEQLTIFVQVFEQVREAKAEGKLDDIA